MTTMTWNQTVDLLSLAAVFDQRTVGEEDVKGWLLVAEVERWTFPLARRVLVEHYRAGADRPRLTPAAVSDGIRAARRQASDSFRVPDMPDALPGSDYPTWYRARLAEHIDAQLEGWAAGEELSRGIIEPGGGPLAIEAAPAHLREQIARDIERIAAMPKPERPRVMPGFDTRDPRRREDARAELDGIRPAEPTEALAERETRGEPAP